MRKSILIAVVVAAFVVVPLASAGGSSGATLQGYYSPSATVVAVKGATDTKTPPASSSGPSTLPFTGSDLAIILLAGVALVGTGFGVRRLGRDKQ